MQHSRYADGIAAGRLAPEQYADNFSDLSPPLDAHEASVEADRCYFCYDAPCMQACPTTIDIPLFIRQIATGNPLGAAKTIFDQNILGGICARVCPTETLCEEACVREEAERKPVQIGRLQRYATDAAMSAQKQFYTRSAPTGRSVAVIGAGPAGLACAHRLAMYGHGVTVFEAREKAGGLNEYGIAAYKAVDGFAQAEVDYISAIGGIRIESGKALGRDFSIDEMAASHDAVFLALGLGGVNALGVGDEDVRGVENAVDFIASLRQSDDLSTMKVGRRVVVIGGGMTAVDAAVQSKLLGAEEVTICYRRGKESMNASAFEQELAAAKGVTIRHWLQPSHVIAQGGEVQAVEFEYTALKDGKFSGTGEAVRIEADQVFKAIGQSFDAAPLAVSGEKIALQAGRILTDDEGRTSRARVWAGGDCIVGGDDLTVSAVAQGRDAAESINRALA